MVQRRPGTRRLEHGSVFPGRTFGFPSAVSGEVVFNTGMVGYPEALTDPSYRGQILVFTYPLIGNYGVPADQPRAPRERPRARSPESSSAKAAPFFSNPRSDRSLADWLAEAGVPGLEGVDTRALTRHLRATRDDAREAPSRRRGRRLGRPERTQPPSRGERGRPRRARRGHAHGRPGRPRLQAQHRDGARRPRPPRAAGSVGPSVRRGARRRVRALERPRRSAARRGWRSIARGSSSGDESGARHLPRHSGDGARVGRVGLQAARSGTADRTSRASRSAAAAASSPRRTTGSRSTTKTLGDGW